jgi:RimJ/RimL family protein N-acetyltransferase
MPLSFEVLGRRHLDWLKDLRNNNREWFIDSKLILHNEMQELWFRLSSARGDLNLVIKDEGQLVGFISVYNISGDIANIGRMMVDNKFKHQGYMLKSLIKVFEICKKHLGIAELVLEVKNENIIARDLYTKMGFVAFGLTSRTVIMRKIL